MGHNNKDPTRGTVDGDRFKLRLEENFIPVLGSYECADARSIVVMDNAAIHNNIRPLIEVAGAKVIYTAPYFPELNPVELCFDQYKSFLWRLQHQPYWYAHAMSLKSVSPDIARAFSKHCKAPLCDHFPSRKEITLAKKRSKKKFEHHCSLCCDRAHVECKETPAIVRW